MLDRHVEVRQNELPRISGRQAGGKGRAFRPRTVGTGQEQHEDAGSPAKHLRRTPGNHLGPVQEHAGVRDVRRLPEDRQAVRAVPAVRRVVRARVAVRRDQEVRGAGRRTGLDGLGHDAVQAVVSVGRAGEAADPRRLPAGDPRQVPADQPAASHDRPGPQYGVRGGRRRRHDPGPAVPEPRVRRHRRGRRVPAVRHRAAAAGGVRAQRHRRVQQLRTAVGRARPQRIPARQRGRTGEAGLPGQPDTVAVRRRPRPRPVAGRRQRPRGRLEVLHGERERVRAGPAEGPDRLPDARADARLLVRDP